MEELPLSNANKRITLRLGTTLLMRKRIHEITIICTHILVITFSQKVTKQYTVSLVIPFLLLEKQTSCGGNDNRHSNQVEKALRAWRK